MLIAAMRRYSIAAAEAQSLTGLAETGQLVTTAALMNENVREKMSFTIDQRHKLHWWSWVNVVLIVAHFMTSTYMAAFQVSST